MGYLLLLLWNVMPDVGTYHKHKHRNHWPGLVFLAFVCDPPQHCKGRRIGEMGEKYRVIVLRFLVI